MAQAGPRKGPSVPRVILMAVLKLSETADWSGRKLETVQSVIFQWRGLEPAMVVASERGCILAADVEELLIELARRQSTPP